MDSQVTVSKQLEVLYEQGAALALEFGTEQEALQEREKAEQGEPEQRPKGQAPQQQAKRLTSRVAISAGTASRCR